MKNLYEPLLFVDLVVDQNRAVDEFTHPRPFADSVSNAGETTEQIDMIQQGVAETRRDIGIILGDIPDNFREVV